MLVVFDFDGTLVDSLAVSVKVFAEIAPKLHLKPIGDLETARRTPTRILLKQMGVRFWQLPRVVRAFQDAAAGHAAELKLFPGIPDALRQLRDAGHRLGVLSSNSEDTIRTCLRANAAEGYFAFVVGTPKLFGKAGALKRILKAEGVPASAAAYVGDELRDVAAAKKAGVKCLAAAWGGFHAAELLQSAGPDAVLTAPAQLASLLQ